MEAATRTVFDWRCASYSDWNLHLFRYFFDVSTRGATVERIPATEEELRRAVGDPAALGQEVVTAFVAAIRSELPRGTSFCHYCLRKAQWNPESSDPPPYFGMLWFTCLLAAGYPDGAGNFRERFGALIGTEDDCRHGQRGGCLNDLWEAVAAWTAGQAGYANLVLPPRDGWMVNIGRSYYLAFPTRGDRKVLVDVLSAEDLLGGEPPIISVVRAIVDARERFGEDFRTALDHFVEDFLRGDRDPTESAFWRSIRVEASYGFLDEEDSSGTEALGLGARWDDDDSLLVRVTLNGFSSPLAGTVAHPLSVAGTAGPSHYITDAEGSADTVVEAALAADIQLPRGVSSRVRQGVLIFDEEASGEYRLAMGEQIEGAEVALVRAGLVEAFAQQFGGFAQESRFTGWCEVEGCRVYQLSDLPSGLRRATQLLHTTSAPRPRVGGGLRVAGGYLWAPLFKPVLRSPSASGVRCRGHGAWLDCVQSKDAGDWEFPRELQLDPPTDVAIEASFDVAFDGRPLRRVSRMPVRFVAHGHGCQYKTPSSGDYWRERAEARQVEHRGGEAVDLDITSAVPADADDLLKLDPSARYLGSGLGEMSRFPSEGFPWLAVGPKKHPRQLVYLGDLDDPALPDAGESSDKGDRRAWSQAFTAAKRVTAPTGAGYVDAAAEPRLQAVLASYRKRARRHPVDGEKRVCAPSNIDLSLDDLDVPPDAGAGRIKQAVEALSGLGLARGNIRLKELQAVVSELTRNRDFLLWEQVIRGWAEAGMVDLLRRQDRSETLVVPRSPRFVMVRRGSFVEARLIGLTTLEVERAIQGIVGSQIVWTRAISPFQPAVLGLAGLTSEQIASLSARVGLVDPEWIRWPDRNEPPAYLKVGDDFGGVTCSAPPEAYVFDARWDWEARMFRRQPSPGDTDSVAVERRRHPQRCSIYVVLVEGEAMAWSHLRSWALLRASELRDVRPFEALPEGTIEAVGRAPMHLPLSFGRMCSVVGRALPGPVLDREHRVTGYRYPFGSRLLELVRPLFPTGWVRSPTH